MPVAQSLFLLSGCPIIGVQGLLMWFNKNGHFAKHDNKESEVSNEYPKNPTALHRRIQS